MTKSSKHVKAKDSIRVVLANRARGQSHSIEELVSTVCRFFPKWVSYIVVSAPRTRARFDSLFENLRWAWLLKDCDIIHQTGDIHYTVLSMWRCPVILTIHDLRFVDETSGIKRWQLWVGWLFFPCLKADRVTVISEFTKSRLLAVCRIRSDKVKVIPNCVAPEFTYIPRPWPDERPTVLLVGTTDNKNLSRVVTACTGLEVQLCILGNLTGSQQQQLDQNGVEHECHQGLTRQEVVSLYQSCELVVFVSTYEGFGMPILEAQAVGRPVLTSDISPMKGA
jgi:glycosyltransferase involved in cell wall biosynthesis